MSHDWRREDERIADDSEHYARAREINEEQVRCDWCGAAPCTCDDLFDADELGLDPEDDDRRRCGH